MPPAPHVAATAPRPVQQHTTAPWLTSQQAASTSAPVPVSASVPTPRWAPEKKASSRTFTEGVIGRNVLGIAASLLIFLGLIFLGVLVYDHLTDAVKIALMFGISTILTGLGVFLSLRSKNAFTTILTGCGSGALFISILLTHVYFNKMNDIVAFALLLCWLVVILLLAKKLESITLSVIAHIGMVFSICFAYTLSLTDDKLFLLLVYQLVSSLVLIAGNIICCKKTYRFGLFISFFLSLYASIAMWGRFYPFDDLGHLAFSGTDLSVWIIAGAFIVQFLLTSALSYLLAVSTNRLENKDLRYGLHVLNKFLWAGSLFMNVLLLTFVLAVNSFTLSAAILNNAAFVVMLIGMAIIITHACISVFMHKKLGFKKGLEVISIMFLSGITAILMLVWRAAQTDVFNLSSALMYLGVPGLFLALVHLVSKHRVYLIGALAFCGLDLFVMLFGGYADLANIGTLALSFAYMFMYLVVLWIIWVKFDPQEKVRYREAFILAACLITEMSTISMLLISSLQYRNIILLLVMTLATLVSFIVRLDRFNGPYNLLHTFMRLNEFVWVIASALYIAYAPKDTVATILALVLFVLAVGLAFVRAKELFDTKLQPYDEVWYGLKFTGLTLALINGFTPWLESTYVVSLIVMMTALVCIMIGFAGRLKPLRLYGLVLVLMCVFKLVTYDVADLNTYLRVVALIGGGIICFIISAIYTYSIKRLDTAEEAGERVLEEDYICALRYNDE